MQSQTNLTANERSPLQRETRRSETLGDLVVTLGDLVVTLGDLVVTLGDLVVTLGDLVVTSTRCTGFKSAFE
jgi:hypothetical protein